MVPTNGTHAETADQQLVQTASNLTGPYRHDTIVKMLFPPKREREREKLPFSALFTHPNFKFQRLKTIFIASQTRFVSVLSKAKPKLEPRSTLFTQIEKRSCL